MNLKLEYNRKKTCEIHNIYRKNHGVLPLILNDDLCKDAQKFSEYLANLDKIIVDKKPEYGQNILTMKGANPNGINVTNIWYSEIKTYDYNNPEYSSTYKHFTQVVWRSTQLFGYGEAKSKSNTFYIVARYLPAGNSQSDYESNILAPTKKTIISSFQLININIVDIDLLNFINIIRKKYGCESLIYSESLATIARTRAEKYLNDDNGVDDENFFEYGENYCICEGADDISKIVVDSWYSENESYDYSNPIYSDLTKNFTQLIWNNSKEVAFAELFFNKTFVLVAIFNPKGNIENEFISNVKHITEEMENGKTSNIDTIMSEINKNKILNKHNEYRVLHQCKPLKWSNTLENESIEWVEKLCQTDRIFLKPFCPRGQIISFQWETDAEYDSIIDKWYSTEKYYDYRNPNPNSRNKYFTQIVWKSTQFMGFSHKTTDKGLTIYVAFYWPPGNINGLYEDNIWCRIIEPPTQEYPNSNFINLMLKYHNKYRIKHRSSPFTINPEISIKATDVACELSNIIIGDTLFGHSIDKEYTYNYLISHKKKILSPKEICKLWYSTSLYFDYFCKNVSKESAPFTEMVWNTTKEIGIGYIFNEKIFIVVVFYDRNVSLVEKISACVKPRIEIYRALSDSEDI